MYASCQFKSRASGKTLIHFSAIFARVNSFSSVLISHIIKRPEGSEKVFKISKLKLLLKRIQTLAELPEQQLKSAS